MIELLMGRRLDGFYRRASTLAFAFFLSILLQGCGATPSMDVEAQEHHGESAQGAPEIPEITTAQIQIKLQHNGPTGWVALNNESIGFERLGTLSSPYPLFVTGGQPGSASIVPLSDISALMLSGPRPTIELRESSKKRLPLRAVFKMDADGSLAPIEGYLPVVTYNLETRDPYVRLVPINQIQRIEFEAPGKWETLPVDEIETGLDVSAEWRQAAYYRRLVDRSVRQFVSASKEGVFKEMTDNNSLPDPVLQKLGRRLLVDAGSDDCEPKVREGVVDLTTHINSHLKCLRAEKEIEELKNGRGISTTRTPLTTIYLMDVLQSRSD